MATGTTVTASEGGWAEDGQLAGENVSTEEGHEVNGTSLHPFYAYEPNNGEGAFQVYVYPGTVAPGSWQSYSEEDTYSNGYWCAGFGFGTAACRGATPHLRRLSRWVWRRGTNDSQKTLGKITSAVARHLADSLLHAVRSRGSSGRSRKARSAQGPTAPELPSGGAAGNLRRDACAP
jgi:hypothetical protein